MTGRTLMIQGTTSDAGKSIVVTGLCRIFSRMCASVAPFKPQNMALNSAVTIDGGEIGRAQAVQAQACGLEPHTDMNPVLLKPNTDVGAQVIVNGHAVANMDAKMYHRYKSTARHAVLEAHARLSNQYQLIVTEGAGSPAEINLRENDIANMGFAETVDCPVILVADIDRGGVFAQIVGTMALLSESEQSRIAGFIINRFRGDIALLQSGIDWLEQETGKPVLGVIPYIKNLHIESEDSVAGSNKVKDSKLRIVVPVLSRISNHTDFDPLRLHPDVDLVFVNLNESVPPADLIILPGSKNVRADLEKLRQCGWEQAIQQHLRYNGKLIGICAGYQMLGIKIHDPDGVEGAPGSSAGFGFLDTETTLTDNKTLTRVNGHLALNNASVNGYEIHSGITNDTAIETPAIIFDNGQDGVISNGGQILGTYLHGLFDHSEACQTLLQWAGMEQPAPFDYHRHRENEINRLADIMEQHLDIVSIRMLTGIELEESARF